MTVLKCVSFLRPENSVTELGEIEPELIFHYLAQILKEYNTFNRL